MRFNGTWKAGLSGEPVLNMWIRNSYFFTKIVDNPVNKWSRLLFTPFKTWLCIPNNSEPSLQPAPSSQYFKYKLRKLVLNLTWAGAVTKFSITFNFVQNQKLSQAQLFLKGLQDSNKVIKVQCLECQKSWKKKNQWFYGQ